jgi:hypothetical protein
LAIFFGKTILHRTMLPEGDRAILTWINRRTMPAK